MGALALGACSASAHNEPNVDSLVESQIVTNPYAYAFPCLGATGASLFPMRHCNGFKLEEATVDDIQEQLANGSLSSVALLGCYLDRIHQTQPYLKYVGLLLPQTCVNMLYTDNLQRHPAIQPGCFLDC